MLLKKIFIVVAAVALLTGCCCKTSYNIALLGDIHYDRMDLHDMEVYKKFNPKVPLSQGVLNKDGLFSWRSQTMWVNESLGEDIKRTTPKNEKMWKKNMPELLDNAAKTAKECNSDYLFQLGDMVQGDAGTYELHKKMVSGGFNAMTSRFSCPVLSSIGNHDTRGPGGLQSWREIVQASYDKNVKCIDRKDANFYFEHGGDIYFFYDFLNPDLDMLEKAAKMPCRYFFFVSHIPVVAAQKAGIKNVVSDDTERLLSILLECNAIVLSGHTHGIALYNYNSNGKNITQFVINSTLRNPKVQKNFTPKVSFSKDNKNSKKQNALWDKLFEGKVNVEVLTQGSGFGILRVSDEGVYVDFYNVDRPKTTFVLRKN